MKKTLYIALMMITAAFIDPTWIKADSINVNYTLRWDNKSTNDGKAVVHQGVVYVPVLQTLSSSGLKLTWDNNGRRAAFDSWKKKFAVRVGSSAGMLDGKLADVGGAPFKYQEELYIPIRFLARAIESDALRWDAKTRTITAHGLNTYRSYSAKHGGLTYIVEPKESALYVVDRQGREKKLAKLGAPIYEYLSFRFRTTPGGLLQLTLNDNYGEPHINNRTFSVIMKDGAVIHQSHVHYWMRFQENVGHVNNQLLITDGHTLRLIEDGTGAETETLDLQKLGGEKDEYFVEGMDEDILLIRPNDSGILMLIDRKFGTNTALYKKLLSKEEQEYVEVNDVPYRGDHLTFVKRSGDVLYFKNKSPFTENKDEYLTYKWVEE
ncbi:stalk domain-containing protein [Paenibacillus swuensis]|uniref:stalk domain-containing protein n=1 Tax=Paenibacillus swuensis TaxID=1178515 RepID=UPI000837DAD7|nr:stalk domain-containing protein [Paenibacillus swuensis]